MGIHQIQAVGVEVLQATPEQSDTLANLFQLYAYDFSDFHDVEIGEDGRFAFAKLPLFWSEPNRQAFLFRYGQKLAGFALVKKGSEVTKGENVWDMAEFFVCAATAGGEWALKQHGRFGVGCLALGRFESWQAIKALIPFGLTR